MTLSGTCEVGNRSLLRLIAVFKSALKKLGESQRMLACYLEEGVSHTGELVVVVDDERVRLNQLQPNLLQELVLRLLRNLSSPGVCITTMFTRLADFVLISFQSPGVRHQGALHLQGESLVVAEHALTEDSGPSCLFVCGFLVALVFKTLGSGFANLHQNCSISLYQNYSRLLYQRLMFVLQKRYLSTNWIFHFLLGPLELK